MSHTPPFEDTAAAGSLRAVGASDIEVQLILGHADIETSKRLYGKLLEVSFCQGGPQLRHIRSGVEADRQIVDPVDCGPSPCLSGDGGEPEIRFPPGERPPDRLACIVTDYRRGSSLTHDCSVRADARRSAARLLSGRVYVAVAHRIETDVRQLVAIVGFDHGGTVTGAGPVLGRGEGAGTARGGRSESQ